MVLLKFFDVFEITPAANLGCAGRKMYYLVPCKPTFSVAGNNILLENILVGVGVSRPLHLADFQLVNCINTMLRLEVLTRVLPNTLLMLLSLFCNLLFLAGIRERAVTQGKCRGINHLEFTV